MKIFFWICVVATGLILFGCATKPQPQPLLCPNCHLPVVELLDHLRPTGGFSASTNSSTGWWLDWAWTCQQFNRIPAPENPEFFMFGTPDLSKDIVKKSTTGETVRVHQGWVYRFYPNGGIDSMTQLSNDPKIQALQIH